MTLIEKRVLYRRTKDFRGCGETKDCRVIRSDQNERDYEFTFLKGFRSEPRN